MRTQNEEQMGVQIRPDRCGTRPVSVSVEVDEERRELAVSARGERLEFALCEERPERLGWVERCVDGGRVRLAASRRRRCALPLPARLAAAERYLGAEAPVVAIEAAAAAG